MDVKTGAAGMAALLAIQQARMTELMSQLEEFKSSIETQVEAMKKEVEDLKTRASEAITAAQTSAETAITAAQTSAETAINQFKLSAGESLVTIQSEVEDKIEDLSQYDTRLSSVETDLQSATEITAEEIESMWSDVSKGT